MSPIKDKIKRLAAQRRYYDQHRRHQLTIILRNRAMRRKFSAWQKKHIRYCDDPEFKLGTCCAQCHSDPTGREMSVEDMPNGEDYAYLCCSKLCNNWQYPLHPNIQPGSSASYREDLLSAHNGLKFAPPNEAAVIAALPDGLLKRWLTGGGM